MPLLCILLLFPVIKLNLSKDESPVPHGWCIFQASVTVCACGTCTRKGLRCGIYFIYFLSSEGLVQ